MASAPNVWKPLLTTIPASMISRVVVPRTGSGLPSTPTKFLFQAASCASCPAVHIPNHIPYSTKFWREKTLVNYKPFTNILPNQIYLKILYYRIKSSLVHACMTTNTIDNNTLTWTSFHHSYQTAMVLSGQTLSSQGAYRLEIISTSST